MSLLTTLITLLLVSTAALADEDSCFRLICPQYVLSSEKAYGLHKQKDSYGPTFSGTVAWKQYLELLEREAAKRGVIDFRRNYFTYRRWHTTEWPNKSGWSLMIGGEAIEIASYGANSGSTGPAGITAEIVLFSDLDRVDPAGKLLVLQLQQTEFQEKIPDWIYEPSENRFEYGHKIRPEETVYQNTVSQLFTVNFDGSLPLVGPQYLKLIKQLAVAGVVVIFDMADERVNGLYSYPTPALYEIPTLYLGRESGKRLLEKMRQHKQATLKLAASIDKTESYQLVGFLPGRNYGKEDDEIILMITHTDGPSISQENGPLGLLGIIHYFSQFDRARRQKTLMLFLDSRHYIPNREAAVPDHDIEKVLVPGGPLAPKHGKIVASVHLEHLGQIEFHEIEGKYEPTGRMEAGAFNVTGYQRIVDLAKAAIIDNQPKNQFLRSTDFPGIHCRSQGIWFGLGHHPRKIGVEAIASGLAFMGAYWTTAADIAYLDIDQFIRQVNVMTQITGNFMLNDIQTLLAEKARSPCESETAVDTTGAQP